MANVYESMTTEELDEQIKGLEADVEELRSRGLALTWPAASRRPSRSHSLAPCLTC